MAKQTSINLIIDQGAENFSIAGGDNQKVLTISGSDVTLIGTGNTYTFPAADITVVGEDSAQTLTNKTVSGSFSGSGANLSGIVYGNLTSVPGGIVSSSEQVQNVLPEGVISSSAQFGSGDSPTFGSLTLTNALTGSSITTWRVRIPVGTNLYD